MDFVWKLTSEQTEQKQFFFLQMYLSMHNTVENHFRFYPNNEMNETERERERELFL